MNKFLSFKEGTALNKKLRSNVERKNFAIKKRFKNESGNFCRMEG